MTGTSRSSAGLDPRRRRILFRAWRRGTREMDLLLGRFADAHIANLDEGDLAALEQLMEVPDGDLFAWVTGREPVAADYATPLYRSIVAFHARRSHTEP
jgi:antitoxin CptB